MGVATADELSRQKEQLMRTEQVIFDTNCGQTLQPILVLQRLDDINSTLRNSEKHIQVTNTRLDFHHIHLVHMIKFYWSLTNSNNIHIINTDISQGIRSVFGAVRNYFGGKVFILSVFQF